MTRIRRINVSQVEGDGANNNDTNEIRPYGELAVYMGDNEKLELLMFDGVRTHLKSKLLNKGTFFGGDADSSDGANLDTIKLVPDEELRRNGSDQYIIIDPTAPSHVHIRPGGTIDNSNADLYIGGEKNYVRISDSYDNVAIGVDDGNGSNKQWMFNSLGKFFLPSVGVSASTEIYASTVTNNGLDYQGLIITPDPNFDVGQGLKIYPTAPNPETNHLHVTANGPGTVDLFLGDDNRYVKLAANGFVEICGNGLTVWGDGVMSSYAYINMPNNSDAETMPVVIGNYTATGVLIQAGSGSPPHNWQFMGDGDLTFPSGGSVTFDSSATSYIYGVTGIEFADGTTMTTAVVGGGGGGVELPSDASGYLNNDGSGNLSWVPGNPGGSGLLPYSDVKVISATTTTDYTEFTLSGTMDSMNDYSNNIATITLTSSTAYGKTITVNTKNLWVADAKINSADNLVVEFPPNPTVGDIFSVVPVAITQTVTAGSFVIGETYTIVSLGTTNFTAIGASFNGVGQSFIATGVGSGTGTASTSAGAKKLIYKPAAGQRARTMYLGSTPPVIFGQGGTYDFMYVDLSGQYANQPATWVYAGLIDGVPTWYHTYF